MTVTVSVSDLRRNISENLARVMKGNRVLIRDEKKNIFPAKLTTTEEYLQQHILFDVDAKVAKIAGLYWQQHAKQLKNLSLTDCLIAATANVNNLTLVSLNTKHFPMTDIRVLNPLH